MSFFRDLYFFQTREEKERRRQEFGRRWQKFRKAMREVWMQWLRDNFPDDGM